MTPSSHIATDVQRFTLDGSEELERRLAELCGRIRLGVADLIPAEKLDALVLGGGYGRGEGGVLRTPTGDAPYNDLEFYVFVKGNSLLNERRYRLPLDRLGGCLSADAGLHVEFKLDSISKLRRAPVSIFSYDLVSGHRLVCGDRDVFRQCERHSIASQIERSEGARLLLNRCSGLLLAKELLQKPSLTLEECDFIGRNLAKAELALGDALLAVKGKYHWSCVERERLLRVLHNFAGAPFSERVLGHHASGARFKLHPLRVVKSPQEFALQHRQLTDLALEVWLWIENFRLQTNFTTIEEYALSPLAKCSGSNSWRNILLNLRTFGAAATLDKYSPRYPRERLLNALPLLLARDEATAERKTRSHLQRQLHTQADDWQGLVCAYKQVWSCYG
jgi:hypothetical protein